MKEPEEPAKYTNNEITILTSRRNFVFLSVRFLGKMKIRLPTYSCMISYKIKRFQTTHTCLPLVSNIAKYFVYHFIIFNNDSQLSVYFFMFIHVYCINNYMVVYYFFVWMVSVQT